MTGKVLGFQGVLSTRDDILSSNMWLARPWETLGNWVVCVSVLEETLENNWIFLIIAQTSSNQIIKLSGMGKLVFYYQNIIRTLEGVDCWSARRDGAWRCMEELLRPEIFSEILLKYFQIFYWCIFTFQVLELQEGVGADWLLKMTMLALDLNGCCGDHRLQGRFPGSWWMVWVSSELNLWDSD